MSAKTFEGATRPQSGEIAMYTMQNFAPEKSIFYANLRRFSGKPSRDVHLTYGADKKKIRESEATKCDRAPIATSCEASVIRGASCTCICLKVTGSDRFCAAAGTILKETKP